MDIIVGSKIKIHNYTPNPEINNQEGIIINKSEFDKYTIRLSNGVELSLNSKYMILLTLPESLTNHIENTGNIEESTETSEPVDIVCSNCQVKNSKEGQFCYKCGYSLGVTTDCCVCFEKTTELTACGHPLCKVCSKKLQKNECPICKQSIYTEVCYVNLLSSLSIKILMFGLSSNVVVMCFSFIDRKLLGLTIRKNTPIFRYWTLFNRLFLNFCVNTLCELTCGLIIGIGGFRDQKFKNDGNIYLAFNGKTTK